MNINDRLASGIHAIDRNDAPRRKTRCDQDDFALDEARRNFWTPFGVDVSIATYRS